MSDRVDVGQRREASQAADVRARGLVKPDAIRVMHIDGYRAQVEKRNGLVVWMKISSIRKRFPVVVTGAQGAQATMTELEAKVATLEAQFRSAQATADAAAQGTCLLAGPGRGDCEHAVGLRGRSIPGQHDGPDDTVDAYGKPNGWCWMCWRGKKVERLEAQRQEALATARYADDNTKAFAQAFCVTVEAAVARAEASKGGQHAPFHGDFHNLQSSALGRLRWWARCGRTALNGDVATLLVRARNEGLEKAKEAVRTALTAGLLTPGQVTRAIVKIDAMKEPES